VSNQIAPAVRHRDVHRLAQLLSFTVLENNVLYARLHLQHEVTDECAC
jgi:hypothetical protein